jgi:aldehyde dehydrogenase (NAD+)
MHRGLSSPPALDPATVTFDEAALLDVFRRQHAHKWAMAQRPAADRVDRLRALKRAIARHRDAILQAMHDDFRKSRTESELSEIQLVMTELNEAIVRLPDWASPVRVKTPMHLFGTRSEIRYQPRGVVLIMAAWNYPFALIFAPLVPAVAAGNCVIVRPSDKVPHTNAVARAIVAEAFPPEEVAMIEGDRRSADALLGLPFDHVFFTGSTAVGHHVMAAAARHVTSVTLELGGKSPAIVDETADIPIAARRIMWGKFVNGGQTCVAPDYALVHASVAPAFFDAARQVLAGFYGATEDARRSSPDFCRIIDDESWRRVTRLLNDAVAAGARVEAGGGADASDRYIAPTLLSNVDPASALMTEEIFGPILPVVTYRHVDDAIEFVRARPTPLAMYLFSRDPQRIEHLLASTAAGGTVVNNCLIHLVNPNLPFGGAGQSGFGAYHGRYGFETFSHARAVVTQGRSSIGHLFHPPYARLREGWLGRILAVARRARG